MFKETGSKHFSERSDELIVNIEDLIRKIHIVQKVIDVNDIGDFYIIKYENDETLIIAGSFDFCYYHDLEIIFKSVSFISCPGSVFKINRVRLANQEEEKKLRELSYGYNEGFTICLEDTDFKNKFFVSAQDIDYSLQKVYYYKREDLKPNERIADWVK